MMGPSDPSVGPEPPQLSRITEERKREEKLSIHHFRGAQHGPASLVRAVRRVNCKTVRVTEKSPN